MVATLEAIGCQVSSGRGQDSDRGPEAADVVWVLPASWRPDLADGPDLIEEVGRLEGLDRVEVRPKIEIVARGIAHVPEGRQLFPTMTVRENLELGARSRAARAGRAEMLQRVFELFPRLRERREQLAGTLSGGEQQMCAIGRGLMARPRLLMLDEPSLGLAPVLVKAIFEDLVRINAQGITVLLVEQNVLRALHLAHRGYVLENGRMTLSGPRDELLASGHIKQAYLGL